MPTWGMAVLYKYRSCPNIGDSLGCFSKPKVCWFGRYLVLNILLWCTVQTSLSTLINSNTVIKKFSPLPEIYQEWRFLIIDCRTSIWVFRDLRYYSRCNNALVSFQCSFLLLRLQMMWIILCLMPLLLQYGETHRRISQTLFWAFSRLLSAIY